MSVESVSYSAANEPEDTEQPCLLLQQDFITCVKGGLNTHWLTSSISALLRCRRNLCRPFMYFLVFGYYSGKKIVMPRCRNHSKHTHPNTIPTKVLNNTLKLNVLSVYFPIFLLLFCIHTLLTALRVHKKARDRCTRTGQKAASQQTRVSF